MASDPPPDGVTITYTRAARAVGLALAATLVFLGVAGWVILRSGRRPVIARAPADPPPDNLVVDEPRARPLAPNPPPPPPSVIEKHPSATPGTPPAPAPNAQGEPTYTLLEPGEQAGLGVFPPPGTKPIKRGIVVPDDFELPEGYVRHYQMTDDGRRLPPILMFHPDHPGVDANGNPLQLPEDRVVPPGMAPPGLKIEMLDPDKTPSSEPAAAGRAR